MRAEGNVMATKITNRKKEKARFFFFPRAARRTRNQELYLYRVCMPRAAFPARPLYCLFYAARAHPIGERTRIVAEDWFPAYGAILRRGVKKWETLSIGYAGGGLRWRGEVLTDGIRGNDCMPLSNKYSNVRD